MLYLIVNLLVLRFRLFNYWRDFKNLGNLKVLESLLEDRLGLF